MTRKSELRAKNMQTFQWMKGHNNKNKDHYLKEDVVKCKVRLKKKKAKSDKTKKDDPKGIEKMTESKHEVYSNDNDYNNDCSDGYGNEDFRDDIDPDEMISDDLMYSSILETNDNENGEVIKGIKDDDSDSSLESEEGKNIFNMAWNRDDQTEKYEKGNDKKEWKRDDQSEKFEKGNNKKAWNRDDQIESYEKGYDKKASKKDNKIERYEKGNDKKKLYVKVEKGGKNEYKKGNDENKGDEKGNDEKNVIERGNDKKTDNTVVETGIVDESEYITEEEKLFLALFKEGKRVFYRKFGEPLIMEIQSTIPDIAFKNGIVVRVEASTVSISDCEIRRNLNRNILWPIPLPICPGQDLVGRIVYIGQKIRKYGTFQLGDRVCSIHKFLGGNSKYIGLSGAKLIPCPDDVDAAEACCIVRSYLAAYQILYRTGTFELDHHHKILVTGANGNIGRAVIDLAKLARAKVYGAAGARHKRFVQSVLGVPWVHSDPVNWSRLHDIDVVVDCVNYTGNFNDSCTPLIRGGILIRVGSSKYVSDVIHRQRMEIEELDYEFDSGDEDIGKMCGALTPGSKKSAVYSNSMFKHIPLKYGGGLQLSMFATQISYDLFNNIENHWHGCKDDLDYLFAMLSRGKLTPTIAHRISLEQVQKAHKMLETGGLQGTIVCVGEKSRRLPKKQLSKKEIAIKVK